MATRDNLDDDDKYVTLIGRVTQGRDEGGDYFFNDGTGTVRLDSSDFVLPVGARMSLAGGSTRPTFGIGHIEVDVRNWHYAKRH